MVSPGLGTQVELSANYSPVACLLSYWYVHMTLHSSRKLPFPHKLTLDLPHQSTAVT